MKDLNDNDHKRPEGATDDAVEAAGKVSEAMEIIERARGRLYDFHQMIGRADKLLAKAAGELEDSGYSEIAEQLDKYCVGRNVLRGRWTFQVVEEFDDGYYREVKSREELVLKKLLDGKRHVYEAEMKAREQSSGLRSPKASTS